MNQDHKNVRDLLSYPTPKFNIITLDFFTTRRLPVQARVATVQLKE